MLRPIIKARRQVAFELVHRKPGQQNCRIRKESVRFRQGDSNGARIFNIGCVWFTLFIEWIFLEER